MSEFGFTSDEWDQITEAPLQIYLAMLTVDVAVDSLDDEARAFSDALTEVIEKCQPGSWMRGAFEAASQPTATQARGAAAMSEDELCGSLSALSAVLQRRAGDTEAHTFSELLVHLARRIAEATGGLFPGAPRVTPAERELIWRIRQSLDLMHTLHPS
ncbi:MAG: hypothetical protein R3B13_35590 [Polyangiaceae bacterium]